MTTSVLVVDDDTFDRRLVQRVLDADARPTSFFEADCADMAVDIAKGMEVPCLILTDLRMPIIDGFELLKRLKSGPQTQKFPVIAMSSSDAPDDRLRALALGAAAFIEKPASKSECQDMATLIFQIAASRSAANPGHATG